MFAGRYFTVNERYTSWQAYRDNELLQYDSSTALLFSEPELDSDAGINVVMGKQYAKSLPLAAELSWLDDEFAICESGSIIVCPYFDYRQLSDIKIIRLTELIEQIGNSLWCK